MSRVMSRPCVSRPWCSTCRLVGKAEGASKQTMLFGSSLTWPRNCEPSADARHRYLPPYAITRNDGPARDEHVDPHRA